MRRLCSRRDWTARGIMGFEAASDAPPDVRAGVAVATVAVEAIEAIEAGAVVAASDDAAEPVAVAWTDCGVKGNVLAAAEEGVAAEAAAVICALAADMTPVRDDALAPVAAVWTGCGVAGKEVAAAALPVLI